MRKQLLFCVETCTNGVDIIYIRDTLKRFFEPPNEDVVIKFEKLKTKYAFRTDKTFRKISMVTELFPGKTFVIYCVDTDNIFNSADDKAEYEQIKEYCKKQGYEFVWFCKDIEEVFTGDAINDSEKVKRAETFRRKEEINNINPERLQAKTVKIGYSNLINVMDKCLQRVE